MSVFLVDAESSASRIHYIEEMISLREKALRGRYGEANIPLPVYSDELDSISPTFLMAGHEDAIVASCRLMQTMGPHTLSTLMPDIIDHDHHLRSPAVWEMSWIVCDMDKPDLVPGAVARLMIAALELAIFSGVTDIIAIVDEQAMRKLRSIGVTIDHVIGQGRSPDNLLIHAVLIPCVASHVAGIRAKMNIMGNVWDMRFGQISAQSRFHPTMLSDRDIQTMSRESRLRVLHHLLEMLVQADTEQEREASMQLLESMQKILLDQGVTP